MPTPVSPVLMQGVVPQERIFGAPEGAENVNPMPVLVTNQHMLVRWHFTDAERAAIALTGDIWIAWMGNYLPPHMPVAFPPVLNGTELALNIDEASDPLAQMEREMKDFKG